ncbi:hypothetical protein D3C72_2006260 [compost metagenome]
MRAPGQAIDPRRLGQQHQRHQCVLAIGGGQFAAGDFQRQVGIAAIAGLDRLLQAKAQVAVGPLDEVIALDQHAGRCYRPGGPVVMVVEPGKTLRPAWLVLGNDAFAQLREPFALLRRQLQLAVAGRLGHQQG